METLSVTVTYTASATVILAFDEDLRHLAHILLDCLHCAHYFHIDALFPPFLIFTLVQVERERTACKMNCV
jgi:hypothetical protein